MTIPGPASIFLASMGDVDDLRVCSGNPFHFAQSARTLGFPVVGFPLDPWPSETHASQEQWLRDFARAATPDFPPEFQERTIAARWQRFLPECRGQHLLYLHQVFPAAAREDLSITKWCYVDQTMRQFASYFPYFDPDHPANEALFEAERLSYSSCKRVFCLAEVARTAIVEDYGIDPDKVSVVLPGANLSGIEVSDECLDSLPKRTKGDLRRGLRLLLIGMDWRRKGLDLLVEAVASLNARGHRLSVTAIGPTAHDVPAAWAELPWLTCVGRIDKAIDLRRYVETVTSCDLALQLSRADATGMALRECQLLGLGVVVRDTGGAKEMIAPGCGLTLPHDVSVEALASCLLEFQLIPARVLAFKTEARRQRHTFRWQPAVQRILGEIAGSGADPTSYHRKPRALRRRDPLRPPSP